MSRYQYSALSELPQPYAVMQCLSGNGPSAHNDDYAHSPKIALRNPLTTECGMSYI